MSILANYFTSVKINIFDKFESILDKWNKAGKALQNQTNGENFLEIKNIENSITDNRDKNIRLPIIENNLQSYFLNVFERNLFFKYSLKEEEIANSDIIFICVNTPSTKEPKLTENFDVNTISSFISRGIQLSLENVYSSLESICDSILKTENFQLIFRKRILIQKSTVQIETLRFIREYIINFYQKNFNHLQRIYLQEINAKIGVSLLIELKSEKDIENFVDEYFLLVNIPEFLAEGKYINNLEIIYNFTI